MKSLPLLVVIPFCFTVLFEPPTAVGGAIGYQAVKSGRKSKTKKAHDAGLGAVGQPLGGASKGIGDVAKSTGGVSQGIGDVRKPLGGASKRIGGNASTVVSGRKSPVVRTPPQLPSGLGQTHKKGAGRTPPSLPSGLGQTHQKALQRKATGGK